VRSQRTLEFQCSSASRKFLNRSAKPGGRTVRRFQCSSASRKFLNPARRCAVCDASRFQCSSASRKFLNKDALHIGLYGTSVSVLFSEPKIPQFFLKRVYITIRFMFQCSSASRKFLNRMRIVVLLPVKDVSVLFSEPKIPQWREAQSFYRPHLTVSVLFSEPKIPQSGMSKLYRSGYESSFSALQRAENSSIPASVGGVLGRGEVSVLFSEPKIPQSTAKPATSRLSIEFQCSSASRKFLNQF